MDKFVVVELHHGGRFESGQLLHYSGGQINYCYDVDPDLMSYFELMGMVSELGYNNISKLHYRIPCRGFETGLRLIVSDKEIVEMLEDAKMTGSIEVYVEHIDVENVGLEDNQGVEEIDGSDSGYEEIDDESEVNSIDYVSDDEELIEVRQKLQMLKKGKQVEHTESVEQNATETNQPFVPNEPNQPSKPNETNANESNEQFEPNVTNLYVDGGYETEYASSSDYDSLVSTDDEGESDGRRNKPSFPVFNPKIDMTKVEPLLGMKFANPDQLKECLTSYAVAKGYPIKFDRNDKNRVLAICANGCPWRCYATYMQTEKSFQIKSYMSEHKCVRNFKLNLVTSKWLAKVYGPKITSNPAWKLKDFKANVLERYSVDVSTTQCQRAKKKALGEVEMSLKVHYAKLRCYGREILRSNPHSTVKFSVDRPDLTKPGYFKRMYVCLDALKRGWLEGCRPVIGLDGCFLKSYCCGELLTAVGRDGNNQMFPIAWAVVEVESKDSWSWFIELLVDDLGVDSEGRGLTIITDQQKGLVPAIHELLPLAEHRCCARHIYSNFRKKYSGAELKSLFWQVSKSSTSEEFETVMKEIKKVDKDACAYLLKQNPKTWSRAFFSTHSKCEAVENNMCETFNGSIVEARYKPIIGMLEDIRMAVMVRMQKRRDMMMKWEGNICPKIKDKLEENKLNHRFWSTTYNGNMKFEVKCGADGYVVNCSDRTCSCRMWGLSGIPCCHAISAIYYLNDDPYNYVSSCYKVDMNKKAYGHYLQPLNGEKLWPKDGCEPMLPPPQRRMPGRPQKAKRKSAHEEPKKNHQVTRRGRRMQCQNCKQYGHNKKTCKGQFVPSTKPTKLPVRRKEPSTSNDQQTLQRNVRQRMEPSTSNDQPKRQRKIRQRNEQIPNGYGVYISPNTGNTYMRAPGQGKPLQLNSQSQASMAQDRSQVGTQASVTKTPPIVQRNSASQITLGLKRTASTATKR